MAHIATEQIVDPYSGEVLAQAGEVNPPRFIEQLEWHHKHPEMPWSDWFTYAYNSCRHDSD